MRTSHIIVPTEESKPASQRSSKIIDAYRKELKKQEITEVELNRTKIVMIDENGNMKKVALLSEH